MATIKLNDGFTVRTFQAPPDDFDPDTASDSELERFGVPELPPVDPRMRERIKSALRGFKIVEPVFIARPIAHRRPPRSALKHLPGTNQTWSGGVADAPLGQPIVWVVGSWGVPGVAPPAGAPEEMIFAASTWIGIDGVGRSPDDVLQAGCDAQAKVSNGVASSRYRAWYEWYPGNSSYLDNMPVAAGDVFRCLIRLDPGSMNSASIFLSNSSQNIAQHFQLIAPEGYSLTGNCAEWILESNGQLGPLASFSMVSFTECEAGTAGGTTLTLVNGVAINMVDPANRVISAGQIVGPTEVHVMHV